VLQVLEVLEVLRVLRMRSRAKQGDNAKRG